MENHLRSRTAAAGRVQQPVKHARASASKAHKSVATSAGQPQARQISLELHWRLPNWFRKFTRNKIVRATRRGIQSVFAYYLNGSRRRRALILVVLALLVFTTVFPAFQGLIDHQVYTLSSGENAVLLKPSKNMADLLKYDTKSQSYEFNQNYQITDPSTDIRGGGSLVKAQIFQDPSKGITVTDPANQVDFTVTPKFDLGTGKQDQNRVVFPAFNGGGHLVYTAGAIGVKQDVTLTRYIGDTLKYQYNLGLGDTYAARLTNEGSVAIYGSSLPINGNVSTGSNKDAALLQKARQKAVKDKLLFTLPAPKITQTVSNLASKTAAHYELKGNTLTVVVEHLNGASYPLSIDPTITAASGYGGNGLFSFDANIETNVYVDPNNNNFERSPLTGGNLLTWNTSSSTGASHFLGSAVVYASTLYIIGGANGTTGINQTGANYVEQAKINSDGSISTFSSGNNSGLPASGIARFKLLTYNGYIYIIDGLIGNTSVSGGGTVSNTIYYTRVTSESFGSFTNGAQLKNWSTSSNVPGTAVYDYGATVYNGSLYIAGGLNSGGTAQSAVSYAPLLPSGAPGSWSSATALPAGRFGLDMQAYNGHLYVIGGNLGTLASASLTATTLYASINSNDGSIADASWKSGNNLVSGAGSTTQAIENFGTSMSMIYNGYLYVTGGCGTVNANGSCTNVLNYTQLAQLNADGSLGTFFPNDFQNGGTATLARTGTPTVGYNGNMYSIAGCSAMNSVGVACTSTLVTSSYATVNSNVGDISANRNPGDLPIGLYGQGTAVLNGYFYVIGGCITLACTTSGTTHGVSYDTYWAHINADGTLGSWTGTDTVDTTHYQMALHRDNANGSGGGDTGNSNCSTKTAFQQIDKCGLAAFGIATYNGYIYVFGGVDGVNNTHTVYYTKPDPNTGSLAGNPAWVTSTNQFGTTDMAELGALARNGALYAIGGCTGGGAGIGCTGYQATVFKSTIGANGAPGAFSTTNQLQLPANGRGAFGLAVSGNYIYLAGGIDSGTGGCANTTCGAQTYTVLRAKFNTSGNIVAATGSAWTATTATLTQPRRRLVAAVVNGYLYVIAGHNAVDTAGGHTNGTTYGDIQIGKIDMSAGGTGDIVGTFNSTDGRNEFTKTSTGALTPRWDASLTVGAGFIFVTGGCTASAGDPNGINNYPPGNCELNSTLDESFTVYNANNLGVNTWNTPSNVFSTNVVGAGTAVYNGYLYLVGGCTTFTTVTWNCGVTTATTTYAQINADGTLGTWSASSPSLPANRGYPGVVAANGCLYVIGGQTIGAGTGTTTVYKSTIGANGLPGAFSTTNQAQLPGANGRTQFGTTYYAGYIYLAGGYDTANSATVYLGTFSGSDINAWTTTGITALNTARRELTLVSAGAYLYAIGGYDGTNFYPDVEMAQPNTSNGTISSWTKVKEIPYQLGGISAVGANGYLFVFGGRSANAGTACSNDAYYAAVNGDGTVGEWQQAPNTLASARFGTAAAFSNGYFFLSGGHDCSAVVTSNTVQQSGQLSEAIHATYTRYIDFGTDATFRQFYVLGTNAQISGVDIDKWNVIVKTSTGANNSWGQKYTTTLSGLGTGPAYGTPITFQALNGAGVDQGAARYWDVTFDIDQAQSFNFPDTSQPQITKYDLYFSPGPAARLRDGKTFVNEQQTNLDAHP